MATTVPGKSWRKRSSQATESASRWLVGSSSSSLSGADSSRRHRATRRFSPPDMLLLDEPTNHLDADSVAWLERFLHDFPGTVVAITHDRYFLDNVAGWILELDRGHGIPFE